MGPDGGLGSCHQLGSEARCSSGKKGKLLLKLSRDVEHKITGKSIELVKSFKRGQINIACVEDIKWTGT